MSVEGWRYPEIVPDYLSWESFFTELSGPGSRMLQTAGVEQSVDHAIRAKAAEAIADARIARTANPLLDHDGEKRAAAIILAARDDLIRRLPDHGLSALTEQLAKRVRHSEYSIPAPGKRVAINGTTKCRLTVRGSAYPHLIPETDYWSFYFQLYARSSRTADLGSDQYLPEYLESLQKQTLPIPSEYLRRFLAIARDTAAAIDAANRSGTRESAMAELVVRARETLVRTFPENVWLEVKKDASKARDSTVFTYPAR